MKIKMLFLAVGLLLAFNTKALAETAGLQGLYKAILYHEKDDKKFYQFANITFRTVQVDGQLKVAANLQLFFGGWDSNEFLIYDYDYRAFNPVTGQLGLQAENADVSLVGRVAGPAFSGDWFSSVAGHVGRFVARKGEDPKPPQDGFAVKTFGGHYRGTIVNTNPQSSLPERVTLSFITTQVSTGPDAGIKISGNARLYLGDFDSLEYVEIKLSEIQFNFYSRYLTVKTAEYGLTFKGVMSHDGVFTGKVWADGLGEVGDTNLARYPN